MREDKQAGGKINKLEMKKDYDIKNKSRHKEVLLDTNDIKILSFCRDFKPNKYRLNKFFFKTYQGMLERLERLEKYDMVSLSEDKKDPRGSVIVQPTKKAITILKLFDPKGEIYNEMHKHLIEEWKKNENDA